MKDVKRLLAEKDARIGQLEKTLKEQGAYIASLGEFIRKMGDQIKARHTQLITLDSNLRNLKSALRLKDDILEMICKDGSLEGLQPERLLEALLASERSYDLWIKENEPDESALERQREEAAFFAFRPLVSIIARVHEDVPKEALLRMFDSVKRQTYDNWQLCVACINASRPGIREILEELAGGDSRVKVKLLEGNSELPGGANVAFSMAEGEFIGLLDQGDELSPFALYEIVKFLNDNPEADFVYSDEDYISWDGKTRVKPHFKPDWSPDTLLSHNYIGHFSVIRKKLLDMAGGFRAGYDGAQDYDLFLRISEMAGEIAHIPMVLYHARVYWGAVLMAANTKAQAMESAKKALGDHLSRVGQGTSVSDGLVPGTYRVRYAIKGTPEVSIIIPTKDKADVLRTCISSIMEKTAYPNYRVLIVDNSSMEKETFEYYKSIEKEDRVSVISYDSPFNYSAINNFAVRNSKCNSDYLLFLNNDIEVINGEWLEAMLEHAQRGPVGAVGARLYFPNDTVQHAGVIVGHWVGFHSHRFFPRDANGYFNRIRVVQNLSAVTGACHLMRREVFEEVGGFDERFSNDYNDVDLCMKLREKGYLVIYTPYAELYHYESASRGYDDTHEKRQRHTREKELFREKWTHIWEKGDPYFNPNLMLEEFSIKLAERRQKEEDGQSLQVGGAGRDNS